MRDQSVDVLEYLQVVFLNSEIVRIFPVGALLLGDDLTLSADFFLHLLVILSQFVVLLLDLLVVLDPLHRIVVANGHFVLAAESLVVSFEPLLFVGECLQRAHNLLHLGLAFLDDLLELLIQTTKLIVLDLVC